MAKVNITRFILAGIDGFHLSFICQSRCLFYQFVLFYVLNWNKKIFHRRPPWRIPVIMHFAFTHPSNYQLSRSNDKSSIQPCNQFWDITNEDSAWDHRSLHISLLNLRLNRCNLLFWILFGHSFHVYCKPQPISNPWPIRLVLKILTKNTRHFRKMKI